MQKRKIFIFCLIIIFAFSLFNIKNIFADSIFLTKEQSKNIEKNCDSIKKTLKKVQNSDRNTRVSLGSSFQSILSDYITPLNIRLVKNNHSNAELTVIQSQYAKTRDDFNHKYIEYSQELESLISMNCSDSQQFYEKLEKTREKRLEVIELAKDLDSIVDKHIETVQKLNDSLKEEEK